MKYTTMDLLPFIVAETVFTNKVNIPQSASAFITSPQTIISPGYPFAYHTDFFFMWSINFQNGFVSLQFTDIHLKEKDAYLLSEKGNRFCEENIYLQTNNLIWLSRLDITRDTVNYRAEEDDRLYKFWPSTFTINSDYNGKKTNVGTAGQKLNIVFRSCPLEYYKQQPVKGFIAHVQSRDIMSCTMSNYKCMLRSMEIASSSFIGVPMSGDSEIWKISLDIDTSTYRFILITIEEMQISCFSGSTLTIDKDYCNMKSTVKPIEMRITTMKVVLKIQEYCPWYPDVEGFRLRYEFGRTLQSLTDAFTGLEEIYGEYDVKLNETKDNSSGFISITTGCICHAEEMSVAWAPRIILSEVWLNKDTLEHTKNVTLIAMDFKLPCCPLAFITQS
ncbi:uncharacterized protein LOC132758458 [Ruditapes philippinarum]|uniref:uncharacterized protein LOC132758458 n=1 Tax=Ruditapes philippinarum TaxID=129788 RepID=UPI00295B09EE|nr:uncharacterized protein LOC132758458 [Ruditapes philippinarum]